MIGSTTELLYMRTETLHSSAYKNLDKVTAIVDSRYSEL